MYTNPLYRNCDSGVYNTNAENLLGYYTAACKITRKDSNDPAPSILLIYCCIYVYVRFFTIVTLFIFFFFYLANLPYKNFRKKRFYAV